MAGLSKFRRFHCTDLEIYMQYNKQFLLPRCFRLNKDCKCFKDKFVEFNSKDPLSYILKLKKVLKVYHRQLELHNNAILLKKNLECNHFKPADVVQSIKHHFSTLEFFHSIMETNYARIKEVDVPMREIKKLRKYLAFVRHQVDKCQNQMKELRKLRSDFKVQKIYNELILFSHIHSLNMFERFINVFNVV